MYGNGRLQISVTFRCWNYYIDLLTALGYVKKLHVDSPKVSCQLVASNLPNNVAWLPFCLILCERKVKISLYAQDPLSGTHDLFYSV